MLLRWKNAPSRPPAMRDPSYGVHCRIHFVVAVLLAFLPSSQSFVSTSCDFHRSGKLIGLYESSSVGLDDTKGAQQKDDIQEQQLGAWIPVGSVSSMSGLGPTKIRIMGLDLVVWESEALKPQKKGTFGLFGTKSSTPAKWSILSDVCPHRLAPLSLGRVEPTTGCLECPYHGWQFDTDGTLVKVPQLETNRTLPGSVVQKGSTKSFPVHTTGDLLWVFLPSSVHGESFPQSLLPEEYYYSLQDDVMIGAKYYSQDTPASFDFMVENALDPSHFPFAHHGVISDRAEAEPVPIEVNPMNFTHVSFSTSYHRRGEYRERTYGFQRPVLGYTQQRDPKPDPPAPWQRGILVFFVPIEEGKCRLITSLGASKLSKLPIPDWAMHCLTRKLLEGDYIMHDVERKARIQKEGNIEPTDYVLPTSADRGATAFRNWYDRFGLAKAPRHTFGPANGTYLESSSQGGMLDRVYQRNPWLTHTYSCQQCQRALKRAKLLQRVSVLGGVLSIALASRIRFVGTGGTALAVLVFALARRLIRMLEGSLHPSDTPLHNAL